VYTLHMSTQHLQASPERALLMLGIGVMAQRRTRSLVTGWLTSQMTCLDTVPRWTMTLTTCTCGPCTGAVTNCHLSVNVWPVYKVCGWPTCHVTCCLASRSIAPSSWIQYVECTTKITNHSLNLTVVLLWKFLVFPV